MKALDRQVERDLDENETLRNTRDNETQEAVQKMQERTKRIEADIERQGTTTPQQTATLEVIKGNNARLAGVEADMAGAIERTGDPNDPSVRAFAAARDAIIDSNAALQESVFSQGAVAPDIPAVDAQATGQVVAGQTNADVGDLNKDGNPGDADDKLANTRINFINDYKNLLKTKPNDDRVRANAAKFERAQKRQKEWLAGLPTQEA